MELSEHKSWGEEMNTYDCIERDILLDADYRDPTCTSSITVDEADFDVRSIQDRARKYGFVLLRGRPSNDGFASINALSSRLGLGAPYVPRHYRVLGMRNSYRLAMTDVIRTDDPGWLCFTEDFALDYHVDGLLEELGSIKTSILYCVRPAETGGRTFVLNAAGLFSMLRAIDPDAASALTSKDVLTRACTVPGREASRSDAAFSVNESGQIITRYSVGKNDRWKASAGFEHALERALKFFSIHGAADSRWRASVRLEAGDFLLLCNDRITHAREHYRNSEAGARHLVRALYTARVSCPVQNAA